jgi:hypothetical protein
MRPSQDQKDCNVDESDDGGWRKRGKQGRDRGVWDIRSRIVSPIDCHDIGVEPSRLASGERRSSSSFVVDERKERVVQEEFDVVVGGKQ